MSECGLLGERGAYACSKETATAANCRITSVQLSMTCLPPFRVVPFARGDHMAEQKDDSQNANREMVPAVPDDFARLSRQSSARLLGRSTLALSSVSGLALIGLKLMHVLQIQNGSFVASLVLVGFSTLLGAQ